MYAANVANQYTGHAAYEHKPVGRPVIQKFVNTYLNDQLWDCIVGRHHPGFPGYTHSSPIPGKLKARILRHCCQLDDDRLTQEVLG